MGAGKKPAQRATFDGRLKLEFRGSKLTSVAGLAPWPMMRKLTPVCLAAAVLSIAPSLQAISIISGPSFTPATNAPLAGVLQLTTDVPSRVSVLVSDGSEAWEKDFYDLATTNAVPLYGFKPDETNLIQVTVYDQNRNACTAPRLLTFVTAPLPADFPPYTVLQSEPDQMQPGYTLFTVYNRTDNKAYINIVDSSGQVVWYRSALQPTDIDVQQLENGDLFIHEEPPANQFLEMNLLGDTVQTWAAAPGYPVNSHVGFITSHGTILYLSDVSAVVSNFPSLLPGQSSNTNPPLETVSVDDNPVVEISATNGTLLNVWSALNLLDPTRVTYLTGDFPSPIPGTIDTEHANAIIDDTNDNSIIVSQRDENTIFKFSRATGQLIWILAPNASWPTNFQPYLLNPVGTPFEWCYGQHAPELTPQGTLLAFDDGPPRASPWDPQIPDPDNYSRAVEYIINETNMTISQVWDSYDSGQGGGDRLMSDILGNADWEPEYRTVLTTYGWINYVNGIILIPSSDATMSRIVEYTHDPVPQVVFDLSVWDYGNSNRNYLGYYVYRSHRIPDFYAHPAEPVTGLVISEQKQIPYLEFFADPTHSYIIQSSTDLANWTTIGTAEQEDSYGDFGFNDIDAGQFATRFYRVVTQ